MVNFSEAALSAARMAPVISFSAVIYTVAVVFKAVWSDVIFTVVFRAVWSDVIFTVVFRAVWSDVI